MYDTRERRLKTPERPGERCRPERGHARCAQTAAGRAPKSSGQSACNHDATLLLYGAPKASRSRRAPNRNFRPDLVHPSKPKVFSCVPGWPADAPLFSAKKRWSRCHPLHLKPLASTGVRRQPAKPRRLFSGSGVLLGLGCMPTCIVVAILSPQCSGAAVCRTHTG